MNLTDSNVPPLPPVPGFEPSGSESLALPPPSDGSSNLGVEVENPVLASENQDPASPTPQTAPGNPANPEIHFHSHFVGVMAMYGETNTIADYLDIHRDWFCRCAQPMPVELVDTNSYALSLGRFGALGHALEPKICLELLPSDAQGVYRIVTVPMADYDQQGYEVDFNANLHLVETAIDPDLGTQLSLLHMTEAQWVLDLKVTIHLPRFLQALPLKLIEQTGDRVLQQIVGQISHRLTRKVQEDFHGSRQLPLPPAV